MFFDPQNPKMTIKIAYNCGKNPIFPHRLPILTIINNQPLRAASRPTPSINQSIYRFIDIWTHRLVLRTNPIDLSIGIAYKPWTETLFISIIFTLSIDLPIEPWTETLSANLISINLSIENKGFFQKKEIVNFLQRLGTLICGPMFSLWVIP